MGRKTLATIRTGEQELSHSPISYGTIDTKIYIKPCTLNQRLFVKFIKASDLVVGIGPAGTGKSLLALHTGVTLINGDSPIERIVYVRANVDMEEENGIGFLPGDYIDKVKPLAYPILDNLIEFTTKGTADYLINTGRIEVLTMAMMRGRSFRNSFIILDEAQNTSPKAMKTILTRISHDSKLVIIGDPSQVDRRLSFNNNNGLSDLVYRLATKQDYGNYKVEVIKFNVEDIVRHGLLQHLLELYQDI